MYDLMANEQGWILIAQTRILNYSVFWNGTCYCYLGLYNGQQVVKVSHNKSKKRNGWRVTYAVPIYLKLDNIQAIFSFVE